MARTAWACALAPSGGRQVTEKGRRPSGKERVVHMIGNAHIDPVWLWQWPEGYQEVRATFQSAIDRMEEYPEFVFTADSVCYLQWVEESDPDLFEAIRRRIADGRFQVAGGWWVEPDCNIPAGESFVRQALYGQRYLNERFGIIATTGCNADPFGHNASLAQLLRGSGMDSYVFMRPHAHELSLPNPYFWWESPDGSRVLAYRIPHEYTSDRGDVGDHLDKALAQLPADRLELMVFYGVGNHGGGPTRANLDSIRRLNAMDGLPTLGCSSLRAFFDRILEDGDIPVHAGELQHHCVGCYSAHSGVKSWNRRAENLLLRAEKWATVADLHVGLPYPLAALTEAWKVMLFNQFHDTLAGTAIPSAYEDSRDQYGHSCSVAAEAFNRAVQVISRQIDIPAEPDMAPVVVFNPHPWRLHADIELEFVGFPAEHDRMTDDEGTPVAVQRGRSHAVVHDARRRLVFPADVPPLGYRVYRVYPGEVKPALGVSATDTRLENAFLGLEIDPATGWLSKLEEKVAGVDLVGGRRSGHAVVIRDLSDTWGHGVRAYDEVVSEFECTSVRLVEQGPVRAILRVESRYGASSLVEEIVLGAQSRHVEVRAVLDWRERHKLLKLRFPTAIAADRATYEVPYGHIERPADGHEEPAQAWVDVSGSLPNGRSAGLSVLNDGKCGHDARGGDIGITVARSPVYAWHDPRLLDEDGIYEYLDQGRQELTYRLVPHTGDWRAAGIVQLAAELNQPPFALLESYHRGPLPARASYGSVSEDSILLTVLKASEDGDGDLVVRAYESAGRPARVSIELPLVKRTIEAEFGPAEVKTFRVPRDPDAPVLQTTLLEWCEHPPGQPAVGPVAPPEESASPPVIDAPSDQDAKTELTPQEGRSLDRGDPPTES
ncbi:MAG: alpha-mannosidase [Actinobacteria bacterium]|nr:alpha-mannosidase [Actinomycetota bacterium]